jgi:hypothetical protein
MSLNESKGLPITIVSAFVSNANNRDSHKNGEYLKNGKLFLKSTTPKIVFLDEEMFSQIHESDYDPANTKIVLYGRDQMYYMKYIDKMENYVSTENQEKNTKEFMIVMWNKTEYMREAVQINPFNTDHYVWIDFGIRYICKNHSDEEYVDMLNNFSHPYISNIAIDDIKVRIGGIWDTAYFYNTLHPFMNVYWYFAGGVFGGTAKSLIWFADELRIICDEIISIYKTATWEVNLWYFIYRKHPNAFNIYPCDHNETLINGYSSSDPLTHFVNLVSFESPPNISTVDNNNGAS